MTNNIVGKSSEFLQGYFAADVFATSASNPYPAGTLQWSEWEAGFAAGERKHEPSSFATYNRAPVEDDNDLEPTELW